MPQCQGEDALPHQRLDLVLDIAWIAPIDEAGGKAAHQPDALVNQSALAFEVMFPPLKPATTERRSTASNSNSFGVHSVCIGAHLGSWRNRCYTTILSDSQPRCSSRA
jgi:hypothetical protein